MINVAIFGAGRLGSIHAKNVAREHGAQLTYVYDPDEAAAQRLAMQYGAVVADIETILIDQTVDVVLIASSTDTHADLIMRVAAAGKAIFCEKPVDLSLERAHECAVAVAHAGVPCMIGFQRRFDPTFAILKKRLVAGEIGEPEMLIITSRDPTPPPLSFLKSSGGIFRDMLIHDFDIFRWLLVDEADTVSATGSCLIDPTIADIGDIDCAVVTLRSQRGLLCQINASRRATYGYDQRIEVLGSKGMLQAGNHKPTEVVASTEAHVSHDKPESFFVERYQVAYAHELAHFFAVLNNSATLCNTIDDGIGALKLAEAAMLSWREKRIIKL